MFPEFSQFSAVDAWPAQLAWVGEVVRAVYDREPALIMVLASLLVVPVLALSAYLVGTLAFQVGDIRRPPKHPAVTPRPTAANDAAPWPSNAWLDIDGQARRPLPSTASLVRIGRHEDNDVRIGDGSVHRHHAVIHRTPAAEFVITDLSGAEGNGLVINGERRAQASLADGDVIQLGEARMRFASAPL